MSETIRQETITDEAMQQFEYEFDPTKDIIQGQVIESHIHTEPTEEPTVDDEDVTEAESTYNVSQAEQIASHLDAVTNTFVPKSVESAENIIESLHSLNDTVKANVAKKPKLIDEVGQDIIDDLNDTALKGLDNWRLTADQRSAWANVAGVRTPKHLSAEMKSRMASLSPDSESEPTTVQLERLRTQAHNRLKLDNEIVAKYGQDDLPKTQTSAKDVVKFEHKAGTSYKRDAIQDLVTLDASGRAHYQSGVAVDEDGLAVRKLNGRFMSTRELDVIEANQDLIRSGLPERSVTGSNMKALGGVVTKAIEAAPTKPTENVQSGTEKDAAIDAWVARNTGEPLPAASAEVVALTSKGLRGRFAQLKNGYHNAAAKAAAHVTERFSQFADYMDDEDKGTGRKRKALAGVIGVIAIGAGIAAAHSGHHANVVHDNASTLTDANLLGPVKHNAAITDPSLLGSVHPADVASSAEQVQPVHLTLAKGDTAWGLIQHMSATTGNHHNLTNQQMVDVVGKVLDNNGKTWESMKVAPVGYGFNINPDVQHMINEFQKANEAAKK